MSNAVLQLQNASIFQRENLILSEVNVTIHPGDFVYLIGKTGSGKSSFMKTLYGDLPLQEGNGEIVGITLNGLKEKEIPFLRRKLGVVFQDFKLLNDRTVRANLEFVLKATGWKDKSHMENKMDEVFLDSSGESNHMPDFVSDADALLSVVSEFFLPFLDENELISESDREWAKG